MLFPPLHLDSCDYYSFGYKATANKETFAYAEQYLLQKMKNFHNKYYVRANKEYINVCLTSVLSS